MQLHHLTLKRACHHPIARSPKRLKQCIFSPPNCAGGTHSIFPYAPALPVARFKCLVARQRSTERGLPRPSILARRNKRLRPALNDHRMARLRVVNAVCADAGNGLIKAVSAPARGRHGRVAHAVVGSPQWPESRALRAALYAPQLAVL